MGRHEQARIIEIVQATFPINKALQNLRKTFVDSRVASQPPSPPVHKKRTMWPDLDSQDQENDQEMNMILEAQNDRYLEADASKYLDDREFVEDGEDADPEYQQIQHDFKHIQEEVHKEMQLFQSRQKKITYLTQQSQDDQDDEDDEYSEEDDDEDSEQEDLPEEVSAAHGESPECGAAQRKHRHQLLQLEVSPITKATDQGASRRRRREHQKCRVHPRKKIQAFCDNCRKVMCINCILDQSHKGHEMLDINVAAEAQR